MLVFAYEGYEGAEDFKEQLNAAQTVVLAQAGKLAEAEAFLRAQAATLGQVSREDPPVTFPVVIGQGPITPQIASLLQDVTLRGANLAFVTALFLDQLSAFRDAIANGRDSASAFTMLALTGGTLRDLSQQQAVSTRELRLALIAGGVPDIPIPQDVIRAFLNNLRTNGFPADELAIFAQLGLTSADITRIQDNLFTVDIPESLSLFSLLGTLEQANADLAADLTTTPEPTTLFLLSTTAAGLALHRWRQRRTKQLGD